MTITAISQAFNSNCILRDVGYSHSNEKILDFSIGSVPLGLNRDNAFYRSKNRNFSLGKLVHSLKCQGAPRLIRVLSSLHSDPHISQTAGKESTLILMRHGESMWNAKNLFTGCVDVPLTNKGVVEAIEAGKRISNLPLDIIYTSALIRAQMTAMLALTQHRCMKVPIIMHSETERSRTWTQVYSEGTKEQSIPVVKAWQLNERMYGDLQGFNKQETAELYGSEQVHNWLCDNAVLWERERECFRRSIMHSETERSRTWTQVYSEGTKEQSIPVVKAWQLNERMYGDLQGFNKQETAELYGSEQVHNWRRSYHVRPPNGESLEMCLGRAVNFFKEQIEPELLSGKHVMVVAHANSLRSIIMYLDQLTSQEVINLELSTGVPMLYIYREGHFIRRGSPVGSSEAGVYSYTESLALYRQKLEETSQ